jgi:glycosyltransferase involved in cell wall biosynthesis
VTATAEHEPTTDRALGGDLARAPEHASATDLRVLLVDLARRFGGTENRVLHLATALRERGAHVEVVCLADGMLRPRLEAAGVRCQPLTFGRADPRVGLALIKLLRRGRPTVLDTHGVHSQFWGTLAALATRTPGVLLTVHSEYGQEQAGRRRGRWYDRVLRWASRTRARYLAVSEPVERHLTDIGVPAARIDVVRNAVPRPADDALGDREATRRELGLGPEAFVVTTVARLHPVKGHRFMVDALELLPADGPDVHWLVVGDGDEQADLEQRIAAAGLTDRVHLLGFRDDIPAVLHASDLLALPSLTEGLPLVVPEAALQQVPVLATAVGGLPGAYAEDEVRFVPPSDPEALAAAITELAGDPAGRAQLAARGAAATRERFSPDRMLDLTLDAYRVAGR